MESLEWYEVSTNSRIKNAEPFVFMRGVAYSKEEMLSKAEDILKELPLHKQLLAKVLVRFTVNVMEPHQLLNVDLRDEVQLANFVRPNKLT